MAEGATLSRNNYSYCYQKNPYFLKFLFLYLVAPGLSYGRHGLFSYGTHTNLVVTGGI